MTIQEAIRTGKAFRIRKTKEWITIGPEGDGGRQGKKGHLLKWVSDNVSVSFYAESLLSSDWEVREMKHLNGGAR